MTTINAKKGELVNIINGLFQVQDLKGKKFSLVVSKNIALLREALQELENAGKPSEEFMALAEQVNDIATKESEEEAKKKIDALEKENEELVQARRDQMDGVTKMMEEEAKIDLHVIKEDILPEEITAQQINKLIKIIE
tara:strand:+ start:135 stop:551 length:417 start_codon:yes stop_codon:yes gene_type:complete